MTDANPTNLSDEDSTKMCDPCSFRDIKTLAGTYCKDCSEYLCHTCEEYHRSSKASRDHELNPLEESQRLSIKQKALISLIMACDVHRTDTLTLFCVNHNVPICSACKSAKHRKCNTKTLKQVSNEAQVKKDVALYTEKAKDLLPEIKDIKDTREKEQNVIRDCSKTCIQEVRRIKLQIVSWAEKLSKDMEDKIENKEKQLLAEKEGDINAVVEINKQIQQFVNSIETLGQDIEDATFVLMMKEKENIEDGIAMKDDLLTQGKSITLELKQSEKIETFMSEITSMGKLEVNEKQISKLDTSNTQEHQLCLQEISSTNRKKAIDTGTNFVTGCAFFSDGELVICDNDKQFVKIFTIDLNLKNELEIGCHVWDVAVVSRKEIVVTEPASKSIQVLTVSNNIVKGKSIPVGMKCWGIDCNNENLYVSCHEEKRNGGVIKVLTMNGDTVNIFKISEGDPYYLAVNSSGDKILVSRFRYGVVCLDNTGNTLFTYSDSQFKKGRGLLFDAFDNFMVCDEGTDTIHVVRSDGTRHSILLTSNDGVDEPRCLAYRPSDNTLVIGQWDTSNALQALLIQ